MYNVCHSMYVIARTLYQVFGHSYADHLVIDFIFFFTSIGLYTRGCELARLVRPLFFFSLF